LCEKYHEFNHFIYGIISKKRPIFVYIKCPQNEKRLQIKRGQYKKVPKQQTIQFIKRGFIISQVKKRTNSPKYQFNILVKKTKKWKF